MLQKAFFKVDVVDRIYNTPVFEKTTPGAYEFTVPEEYNYIVIEYAGAGGGRYGDNSGVYDGGKGSILKINKSSIPHRKITGIVGSAGGSATPLAFVENGGSGYRNGERGGQYDSLAFKVTLGGGGGSTSVLYNNIIHEASAGGGASSGYSYGGKGGGEYGGARKNDFGPGNDATDPNRIGLNSGDGYVKIWAGYDPYFKG